MIIALGIDSVEIDRFRNWHTFSAKKLSRIFSPAEIHYCLSDQTKSAERFAVRFSAKEALFKAISQAYPQRVSNLLLIARSSEMIKKKGAPEIIVNWHALKLAPLQAIISATHTRQIASASIILQRLQ